MTSYVVSRSVHPSFRPWATASGALPADTSPVELSALSEHVESCNGRRGRLFALGCAADAVQSFLAPRLITTLVVIAALIGVAAVVV